MGKYIDAYLLRTEIERRKEQHQKDYKSGDTTEFHRIVEDDAIAGIIDSLQQEPTLDTDALHTKLVNLLKTYRIGEETAGTMADRIADTYGAQRYMDGLCDGLNEKDTKQGQPDNMIQWTGNNLKEVIDFTGKSPRFGEWFKSFEEYENYVHTHNDILKLFCEDGSHYEVPVGAWIVKTPDGYNVPSVAKYVQQEQPEADLEKEIDRAWEYLEKDYSPSALDKSVIIVSGLVGEKQFSCIARHFYELGLNARKEE
jgi:hypothetical protein